MKKKGSSIVFSILMLAFFLALSLNIYFLARKKAERAGVKVAGEITTNNIDMASSLGYQELKLAEKFVTEGFLYTNTHTLIAAGNFDNTDYPTIDADTSIDEMYVNLNNGIYLKEYAGIQLNHFMDYFSSQWNYTNTSETQQKLIMGDKVDGLKINRLWQSAGIADKRSFLWTDASAISIGGYRLVDPSNVIPTTDVTDQNFTAVYEKYIFLDEVLSGLETIITKSGFRIQVTESFIYSKDDNDISISKREMVSFIIEAHDID